MRPTATEAQLWIAEPSNPSAYIDVRYPHVNEVAGRYVYFYGQGDEPTVLQRGETMTMVLPYRDISIQKELGNLRPDRTPPVMTALAVS